MAIPWEKLLVRSRPMVARTKVCPVCRTIQRPREEAVKQHGCSICGCPVDYILAGEVPPRYTVVTL
jgi:hypothetical protein